MRANGTVRDLKMRRGFLEEEEKGLREVVGERTKWVFRRKKRVGVEERVEDGG